MESPKKTELISHSARDFDQISVSTYAGFPPATYKRPFEFPKVSGTFDFYLTELNREMERLKLKVAESRPVNHHISLHKTGNHPGTEAICAHSSEKTDKKPRRVNKSMQSTSQADGALIVRTVHRPLHTTSSPPSGRLPSGKSSKMKDLLHRQVRDATCRIRRIDSARRFSVQRGRERRRRLKLKACSAAGNLTVCSALHKLQHYHLDINNLPFMPSNPSGPSFNVKANVQQVIGKLKTHHPDLCETRTQCTAKPSSNRPVRKCSARPTESLDELEKEYARTYRKYERVKLDIIAVKSKTHLRYLLSKKTLIKERLRNLLQRMENSSAKMFDAKEGLCGRFTDKNLNTQQTLLRDLRVVQNMFENCNV